MARIIGIAGSLRRNSFNASLLNAARELMPAGADMEIGSIQDIPLYNADVEAKGIPRAVTLLKERIITTDGLLLVTPEYNHSMPGVLKNAIDWLTRPPADIGKVFHNRPVAIMGATPGGFGTVLAQQAWLPVLRTLKTRPYFGNRLMVSHADKAFDESGRLVDVQLRTQLQQFVHDFVEFVQG